MSSDKALPLLLIPGFEGFAWNSTGYGAWRHRILVTGRLGSADTLEQQVDTVKEWMAGLPAFAVVGDSLGAVVGLELAARHPGVRALVLSGPFLPEDLATCVRELRSRLCGREGFRPEQFDRGVELARAWRPRRDQLRVQCLVACPPGTAEHEWCLGQDSARWANAGFFWRFDEPDAFAARVEAFVGRIEHASEESGAH